MTAKARIEFRLDPADKALLQRAAAARRVTLGNFILSRMLPEAREAVVPIDRVVVSERDWNKILDLIENPPEPTPALRHAMERYLARSGT